MLPIRIPHVPHFPAMRAHHFDLYSVDLDAQMLQSYDCVVLATAHHAFDYALIAKHARLIVDTRGEFKTFPQDNIVGA